MKHWLKSAVLICFCATSARAGFLGSTWSGKLDLTPSVQPLVLRELHDGQWLAGISKPNLWRLYQDATPRFHVGFFQAWNAEKGNASFGPMVGVEVQDQVAWAAGAVGNALKLPGFFKPASLLGDTVSLDAFAGYRPIHTADVNGDFVYGFAAVLRIPFGVSELQGGL